MIQADLDVGRRTVVPVRDRVDHRLADCVQGKLGTFAEEGKLGAGRSRLCHEIFENPNVQPATLLGRLDGQRTLAPRQAITHDDPALDIQAGRGDL